MKFPDSVKGVNAGVAWDFCESTAKQWGIPEVFQESQKWPGFQKAWDTWLIAFVHWLCKQRPMLRDALTREPQLIIPPWPAKDGLPIRTNEENKRVFLEALFLEGLRSGKGEDPTWYQRFVRVIALAASRGDVKFFQRFAEVKRRKADPRPLSFNVLGSWMSAAMWSCQQDAGAKFIQGHFSAWENNPPNNPGESLRRTAQTLKLYHEKDYRIANWTADWKPVFRK